MERREPPDAGHHPDGRNGQVTGRQPEVVVQPVERVADRVDVGERLAHAHEHHVRHADLGRVLRTHNLLDDLAAIEMPLEARLAGRAERAAHRAARLR
jgi:hypothetical protein